MRLPFTVMGSCHFLILWTPSNLWSATIYVLGIINRTLGLNFNLTSRPPLGDISRFPPSKIRRSDLCGKCYTERDLWVRYFQESNGQIVFFFLNCLLRCCPLSQLTAVSYGHFLSLSLPPLFFIVLFFPFHCQHFHNSSKISISYKGHIDNYMYLQRKPICC